MDDLILALHAAARRYPGGISALARELGKREKTLLSKLDPADDFHLPHIGEFQAILHRLGDEDRAQILDLFGAPFGGRYVTRTQSCSTSLTHAVLQAVAEHGDVVRAIDDALANDGLIDARERTRILREIAEARRAIGILENTLLQTAEPSP